MVDVAVEILGCDRDELLDDFRTVHQKHHDSEHPFALLETVQAKQTFPNRTFQEMADQLDPAFHAFNSTRKKVLKCYPDVHQTLDALVSNDVTLVAHTESRLYAVIDRLERLDLTKFFARIYCRERGQTGHPNHKPVSGSFENFPMNQVIELSHHQRKPNASVLLEICSNEEVDPKDTAYIGDSMARDILMARDAGVFSIWAEYGTKHDTDEYEKLVRITHWSSEDVEREKKFSEMAKNVKPNFVISNSFGEVLEPLGLIP